MEHPSHIWVSDDSPQETLKLSIYRDEKLFETRVVDKNTGFL
jgi:hypothetical protein